MAEAVPPVEQPARLGEFLGQLLEAKQTGGLPDGGDGGGAPTWQGAGGALILALKAEHRRLCEATDSRREAAAEAKAALDQASLQLQNLIYERQHYEKEIASCRGWRSAFSDEQVGRLEAEDCWCNSVRPYGCNLKDDARRAAARLPSSPKRAAAALAPHRVGRIRLH